MAKTERIYLRSTPELKERIEQKAKEDNRTVSNWIESVILEKLEEKGEIKMKFEELKERFEDKVVTEEEFELIEEHEEVIELENCGTSGQDPSKILWVAKTEDDEFEFLA